MMSGWSLVQFDRCLVSIARRCDARSSHSGQLHVTRVEDLATDRSRGGNEEFLLLRRRKGLYSARAGVARGCLAHRVESGVVGGDVGHPRTARSLLGRR